MNKYKIKFIKLTPKSSLAVPSSDRLYVRASAITYIGGPRDLSESGEYTYVNVGEDTLYVTESVEEVFNLLSWVPSDGA